jgi:hypothetical protein
MPSGFNNPTSELENIIGVQFSVLSPEEIRNRSAVEITSQTTYEGSEPKIGGLFDRSNSPPIFGSLPSYVVCDVISTADLLRISSGDNTLNCTPIIFSNSDVGLLNPLGI